MPKLSVIIPVYNASAFLRETIDSVLTQSLTDLELICVDDGSTDDSLDILKEYEEKDSRMLVLTQQNRYAGAARNNGLLHASGDYVHFLDADDKVLPYAYEAVINKAEKYDLDILRFPALSWDVGLEAYIADYQNDFSGVKEGEYNRLLSRDKTNLIFRDVISVAPWAGICRRTFLLEKNIRFNNLRCVNDRSFYWACVTNTDRTMVCRDRVTFHRMNQSGSLIGTKARHFDCVFRSMEITAERLRADEISEDLQKAVLLSEFRDFAYWYRACMSAASAEETEQIRVMSEAFVTDYAGPYAGLLREKYMGALRRAEQEKLADAAQKTKKTVSVLHEACEQPKVSVIVPVCNAEDHLNETFDSLQKQKLTEIEFILVNDGSTDGSAAIMQEYAALDKRIRIFDTLDCSENGCDSPGNSFSGANSVGPGAGFGRAINLGIDAARGKYIGVLYPEDVLTASIFHELYLHAELNRADFVLSDYFRFRMNRDGTRKKQRCSIAGEKGKSCYRCVLCPADEPAVFRFDVNLCSGIYKREFLNRYHIRCGTIPTGRFCRDSLFLFQIFCRAERAYFVDTAYYLERQEPAGMSAYGREEIDCLAEEYRMIEKLFEEEPALSEKLGGIFYAKKFDDFISVYRRTAREDRRECLYRIRDEFGEQQEAWPGKGLSGSAYLNDEDRLTLREITEDPDAYLDRLRVSVIMPVYNGERYLQETLESVLNFNGITFEVICVDDGSTDATPEILREYEEKDDRVRVIRQENGGAGAARNAGIPFAHGEYLAFLDADDIYEPDMLRRAYDRAHRTGADIVVVGGDKYIEETGKYVPMSDNIRRELLPPGEVFAAAEIRQNLFRAFVGWPWDKLFRADYVRENGLRFQKLRNTEDMLFVYAALAKAERISVEDQVLVHHRKAEGTLSVTREKSWGCFYEALCALRDQLKAWDLYEAREQDFINYCLYYCFWSLHSLRGEAYFKLYEKLKGEWLADLGVLIPVAGEGGAAVNTAADENTDKAAGAAKPAGAGEGVPAGADGNASGAQYAVQIGETVYVPRPAAYFYNETQYAHLLALLSMPPKDYLFRLKEAAEKKDASKAKLERLQKKYDQQGAAKREMQLLRSRDGQTARALKEKNCKAEKKNERLSERNKRLSEKNGRLSDKNGRLSDKNKRLSEKNERLCERNTKLRQENVRLKAQLEKEKKEKQRLKNSSVWKWGRVVTWPFRKIKKLFCRRRPIS